MSETDVIIVERRSLPVGRTVLLLLAGLVVASELHLAWSQLGLQRISAFGQGCPASSVRSPEVVRLSSTDQLVVSASAGNKTYDEVELLHRGKTVFQWWGTHSVTTGPALWVEHHVSHPRLLTCQPWIWPETSTPLGDIACGYIEWSWNGAEYLPKRLPVFWPNLWLRSPLPFQD